MAGARKFNVCAYLIVFFSVLANTVSAGQFDGIQCLSSKGQPTDWFIIIKLPEKTLGGNHYYYMDDKSPSWKQGYSTLDQPTNAMYYTLQQVYKSNSSRLDLRKSQQLMYLMYNDQPPDIECQIFRPYSTARGHTKGVIAFDDNTGFWLIHSMPKCPRRRSDGYRWCDNVNVNGQSLLCISMSTRQSLNQIGNQLLYNYPLIYDHSLPPSFAEKYPKMSDAVNSKHVTVSPWNSMVVLKSLAGTSFYSFAKFSKFDADLYADWLAPTFGQTLLVETWQNGRNKLCSNCTGPYKVYNVEDVQLKDAEFLETEDHSKWAVTDSSVATWTCIGDINRQKSQLTRPGGTVCFQNKQVWKSFHDIVKSYHNCDPYAGCVKK